MHSYIDVSQNKVTVTFASGPLLVDWEDVVNPNSNMLQLQQIEVMMMSRNLIMTQQIAAIVKKMCWLK